METQHSDISPVTTSSITSTKVITKNHSRKLSLKWIGLVFAALLLLIIAGLALVTAMAQDSLPGDPLYNFKTTVSEELIAATKLGNTAKADYAVTRLEKRVRELQLLAADTASSSEEVLFRISSLSEAHAGVIATNITENLSLSGERKIDALAAFTSITRAQEIIVDDNDEFSAIRDNISTIESTADLALKASINAFASTSDTTAIVTYLEKQIAQVSDSLPQVANGSRAQNLATRRIEDANEAISDGEFSDAIYFLIKAKEAISVDGYLYAAERGYVDGVSQDAGPVPEGN